MPSYLYSNCQTDIAIKKIYNTRWGTISQNLTNYATREELDDNTEMSAGDEDRRVFEG